MEPCDLYALDIETFTGVWPDGRAANGLDPHNSKVVSLALWSQNERHYFESDDERVVLDLFAAWLDTHPAALLVTWNGAGFDFPFLADRAAACSSRLGAMVRLVASADRSPSHGPLPGHDGGYLVRAGTCDHVDVMFAYRQQAEQAGVRPSLKPVARLHGLDVIEVDRTTIHLLDPMDLLAYNLSDVRATYQLAVRLLHELPALVDSAHPNAP